MPARAAASTAARTAFAPSTWPAVLGRPRFVAQRPFPSMMIATCIGVAESFVLQSKWVKNFATSGPARRLDHRFDVLEVAMQRFASRGGDAVLGLRAAALERFRALDVTRFLELARVRREVAVAHIEERLQLVEGEAFVDREGAHDAEAHALVDE